MYLKRLKICKKLYGENIKRVGKIYITHGRRMFYIYYKNTETRYRKQVKFARYLKEKEIGHKLSKKYEVDHFDENTLNDNISNLKIKTKSNHLRKHHLGMKYSKESKIKIGLKSIGRKWSIERKIEQGIKMKGNKYRLGMLHSDESKKKMSLIKIGKHHNEDTKKKLSKINLKLQAKLRLKRNEELAKKFGEPWSS